MEVVRHGNIASEFSLLLHMSLENQLAAASNREQYIAILKITLVELASALCRLAYDEGMPEPFHIKFKDHSLVALSNR